MGTLNNNMAIIRNGHPITVAEQSRVNADISPHLHEAVYHPKRPPHLIDVGVAVADGSSVAAADGAAVCGESSADGAAVCGESSADGAAVCGESSADGAAVCGESSADGAAVAAGMGTAGDMASGGARSAIRGDEIHRSGRLNLV
ncbi:unnamed protein product [Closterium sp. NIES-54]